MSTTATKSATIQVAVDPDLAQVVDDLGRLKARMADLEQRQAELRQTIIDSGEYEVAGKLFKAIVVTCEVNAVAWKDLAVELGATERQIHKFTTPRTQVSVRVGAR